MSVKRRYLVAAAAIPSLVVYLLVSWGIRAMDQADLKYAQQRAKRQALIDAVDRNDLHAAEVQLKQGIDANTRAYHMAFNYGKERQDLARPLMVAVYQGNMEMVLLLLRYGADASTHDYPFGDALDVLVERRTATQGKPVIRSGGGSIGPELGIRIAEVLIAHGAKGGGSLAGAAEINDVGLLTLLLKFPQSDETLCSALASAAYDDATDTMALLLPRTPLPGRDEALLAACEHEHLGAISLLLEGGAGPNIVTRGSTPLHAAARIGNAAIVSLLLSRGARRDARDEHGKLAREVATGAAMALLSS